MIKVYGKKFVHPNHYLMFRLWDRFYFTSHKVYKHQACQMKKDILLASLAIYVALLSA